MIEGDPSRAGLERERALPGGGDELIEHAVGLAREAPQARQSEDQRVVLALGQLAQARVDVSANGRHLEVITQRVDLGGAAQAARPDASAGWERLQRRRPADRVARILPLRYRH